jgi:hypothetical protein
VPFHLRDENAELDAGRRIVTRSEGELQARAIEHTGGHKDLQLMAA